MVTWAGSYLTEHLIPYTVFNIMAYSCICSILLLVVVLSGGYLVVKVVDVTCGGVLHTL